MKKNFDEFEKFIKDKKTAVVGIGISNRPLINFLSGLGAKVTAFDRKNENQLGGIIRELREKNINLILGQDYLNNLNDFEVIFKTPSMRIDNPYLARARQEGA